MLVPFASMLPFGFKVESPSNTARASLSDSSRVCDACMAVSSKKQTPLLAPGFQDALVSD